METRRVGRYELLDLLGRGGCGEVWKARDSALDRVVALKLLQRTSPEDLARFRREAHAVARLNHPNIAQLYEFGGDPPHLAMQYVEGAPIAKPEHLAAAARAAHHAHQQGILHRDLKPANILVDAAGRAFVLDFGLAREVQGDATAMSVTGDILGTPSYMAPEQARGDVAHLDARTDVYGLGATLYALIEGRPPHTGPTAYEVVRKVIEEDPSPPHGELGTIALKALEKDPARRYATAADFADDLDRHFRHEPIRARPASTLYRLRKQVQRRPAVWGLSATLAVALVAGAAFGTIQLLNANANLERALSEERARADETRAQALVEEARSTLGDVNAAMYIEGCTLEPYFAVLDDVRAKCREALRFAPESAAAHYWIGRADLLEGRLDEAIAELERATRSRDAAGFMWAELGRAHMARGFARNRRSSQPERARQDALWTALEDAEPCFDRATDLAAGVDREAAAVWGIVRTRDYGAALRAADEAIARLGPVPGVEEIESAAAFASPAGAKVERLTRVVTLRPGDFDAYLERAFHHAREDDFGDAIRDLDEAIRINPRCAAAFNNRSGARAVSGDPAGAVADATRALELDPGQTEAYVNRALARWVLGDAEGALSDVDEAIRQQPGYAAAWFNRGILRARAGDAAAAERDFDETLRVDPRFDEALSERGAVRIQRGNLAGAIEDLDEAVRREAADFHAYANRAQARLATGDRAGAMEDAEEAVRREPAHADARFTRALVRQESGDLPGAIEDYTEALRLNPAFYQAAFNRGNARMAAGDAQGALVDFTEAVRLDPRNGKPYLHRGNVRLNTGDLPGAISDFDEAIRLDPALALAWANRGQARAATNDLAGAAADLREALRLGVPDESMRRRIESFLREVEGRIESGNPEY